MATFGVMHKNAGQNTKVTGLNDHLYRRRLDLKREEGEEVFHFPIGSGDGAKSALDWSDENRPLPVAGRKHFPAYTRHKNLGYQDRESRENTPLPQHKISTRYVHLKKSSVFPFDPVKQKQTPVDIRNGVPEVSPGDKCYKTPEESPYFFSDTREVASAPPDLEYPSRDI